MVTKEQKLRLGIFLFVSTVLLIIILGLFLYPRLKEAGDNYFINFKDTSVSGLEVGADVKYQGVDIGEVTGINVSPDDLSSIEVFVRIKKGFPVKKDMRAKLQYTGITGLKFVELYGGKSGSENMGPDGEILMGKGLGEKAEDIVLNVDAVVDAVNKILNPRNQEKISAIIENIERSTGVIAATLEQNRGRLENSIAHIETITRQTAELSENIKEMSDSLKKIELEKIGKHTEDLMREMAARFSQKELGKLLDDLDAFTETASKSVRKVENVFLDIKDELSGTLKSLKESMENISVFTRNLAEDPTILIRTGREKRRKK